MDLIPLMSGRFDAGRRSQQTPLSELPSWGIEVGRESEHTKTGLCILESDSASAMVVATGAGSVRTAVADTRDTTENLVDWLRTVFRRDGWLPESRHHRIRPFRRTRPTRSRPS
jgi:hypothetical protein